MSNFNNKDTKSLSVDVVLMQLDLALNIVKSFLTGVFVCFFEHIFVFRV